MHFDVRAGPLELPSVERRALEAQLSAALQAVDRELERALVRLEELSALQGVRCTIGAKLRRGGVVTVEAAADSREGAVKSAASRLEQAIRKAE
jgi:hypothetical protein